MIKQYCDKCEKECTKKYECFQVGNIYLSRYISKQLCKNCYSEIMRSIEQWLKI